MPCIVEEGYWYDLELPINCPHKACIFLTADLSILYGMHLGTYLVSNYHYLDKTLCGQRTKIREYHITCMHSILCFNISVRPDNLKKWSPRGLHDFGFSIWILIFPWSWIVTQTNIFFCLFKKMKIFAYFLFN